MNNFTKFVVWFFILWFFGLDALLGGVLIYVIVKHFQKKNSEKIQ
jgi:hypothetical protein